MEKKLKTKATEKLFGNKKTVIKEEIKTGKQYVYEITNEGKHYILKGFEINVINLVPSNPSSIKDYLEMIETIKGICQEYGFARFACTLNYHFAKPLILEYDLVMSENDFSYSFLYIEIVFEHGGVSLEKLKGADVNLVYNLMRQSANAFSLLHSIGVTHLDIKPGNMVYDSKENLLKVIDMGSSFGHDRIRKTYNPTITIDNKVRSYTPIYSPPEVLHFTDGSLQDPNFILGSTDTYSWAMSFYSILFNKEEDILELEVNKFKVNGESAYVEFTSLLKNALGNIELKKSEEQKKMKVIEYELLEGLNYRPEKRPTMDKVVDYMKEFENKEGIDISYKNTELKNIQRIKKIFKLEEGNNTSELVEVQRSIETILNNEETKNVRPEIMPVVPKELDPFTADYKEVKDLFDETMSGRYKNITIALTINPHTKKRYDNYVSSLEAEGVAPLKTLLLFHGTSDIDPRIIYDGYYENFNVAYAVTGLWGKGVYFTPDASCSCDGYAYRQDNGVYSIIAAEVAVGNYYDYGPLTDASLRHPPNLPDDPYRRYDSVSGVAKGTRMYVIYSSNQAYSKYLITYSV